MALEFAEWGLVNDRALRAQMLRLARQIHTEVAPIKVTVRTSPEPVAFEHRLGLRERRIRPGGSWGGAFTTAWFHVTGRAPRDDGRLALWLDIDGEALVRDASGAVVDALTSRITFIEQLSPTRGKTRIDLTSAIAPGGRIDLWLDAGFNGKVAPPYGRSRVKKLQLVRIDERAEQLYYDLLTTEAAAAAAPEEHRQRYRDAADAAWACLNDCSPVEIAAAREVLRPVFDGRPDDDLTLTAIGHGHLDLAWLWPIRETRRKAERTLVMQLELLRRYPEASYGVSQPQQLVWLGEQNPELLEQVRGQMLAGRIEPQGGMWVEPDTNLPGGESLVRQMLVGQRFWQQFLGRRVQLCWLPDAFGYSAALPQLLHGGGMTSFVTIKLAWNEVTEFPHRSFVWQGIDGSQVLVHMPPEGTYNSSATPQALRLARHHSTELPVAEQAMLVYGNGDGGGGPSRTHLELLRRSATLSGFPRVVRGTAQQVLDALHAVREQLPVWDGELYLQKHQGTYTTQAAVKKGNRLLEHRLHDVEYLASAAWLLGRGEWPAEVLERSWRDLLLHQFHDMLPGSSIHRVHFETRRRYAAMDAELQLAQAELLGTITGRQSTPARTRPRWLVNTLSTPRSGSTKVDGRWYDYQADPHSSARLTPSRPARGQVDETSMRNDALMVRWRADGSAISSLVDRRTGREYSAGYLNRLVLHHDPPTIFNAWDIREVAFKLPRTVLRPDDVEVLTDGPRLVRRSHYSFGHSTIVQDAILTDSSPYLLFDTRVDWHERLRMLRAESRPATWADHIACEIQFGHLMRSTRSDTADQRAQYEVCAHQWVDLSTPDAGLALLNDGKYGHHAKRGRVSLNLLRSPLYPDRTADRGEHEFRYGLYPHSGGLLDSRTIELARDLNAPLVLADAPVTAPVSLVGEGVHVVAVKKADDGDDLIVRLNEVTGQARTVELVPGFEVSAVVETNLLEDTIGAIDLAQIQLRGFEVRTLRLTPAR